MNNGWVKLHRKLMNSSIWDNPDILKMAIWCLLKASHTEHKLMVGTTEVTLHAGQFVTGRAAGSTELKIKPATWYRRIKVLESVGFCNIKTSNKFSVVTVANWGLYQLSTDDGEQENEQQMSNKRATNEQQTSTNKNGKNEKNDDNGKNDKSQPAQSEKHNEFSTSNLFVPDNPKAAERLAEMRKRIKENANN